MSDIKSVITKQFSGETIHSLVVPEWEIDGKPAKFTFKRATVGEIAHCAKLAEQDAIMTNVRLIALKLLHEDGERVFGEADASWIAANMDPFIVQRIGSAMGGNAKKTDQEQQEKN